MKNIYFKFSILDRTEVDQQVYAKKSGSMFLHQFKKVTAKATKSTVESILKGGHKY